jgi:AraC-like DNA-binding protein
MTLKAQTSKTQRSKKRQKSSSGDSKRKNIGAYDSPFSGVGIGHDPLWSDSPRSGVVIHECGYLESNQNWNFPSVFGPFWRLYYNTDSGHSVVFEKNVVELNPDRIVVIPPHQLFHCQSTKPSPSLWVHFSVSRKLSEKMVGALAFQPSAAELALAQELKEAILEVKNLLPTDRNFRLTKALVLTVLARRELVWNPVIPEHLIQTQRHIEEHYADELTNKELARVAKISPAKLAEEFRKFHSITPARYVREIRVREAAALLLQTSKSLDEIAEKTGFVNRFYMSRVFKKVTRESPAAYRKKHRSSDG